MTQSLKRSKRSANIGSLAVIKILNAFNDMDRLNAMRLTNVFSQCIQHRCELGLSCARKRQGRKRIAGIVSPKNAQCIYGYQALNLQLFVNLVFLGFEAQWL